MYEKRSAVYDTKNVIKYKDIEYLHLRFLIKKNVCEKKKKERVRKTNTNKLKIIYKAPRIL